MITWMQKHKKYLIVTIWVSTISFVGAGFVGWGQYSYGDKAGAIAKVGDIELTRGELQKSYSSLYAQYNSMFQGNFDEEQAKNFGLQKQAFQQLEQQALLLNLAKEYDIIVTDAEILAKLTTQNYFFKDGVFNKEMYKQVLSRNNLSLAEYEADLKKQLTIEKLLALLKVNVTNNEEAILNTIINIADKIKFNLLTFNDVKVKTTDNLLKTFWETRKQNYMSEVAYEVEYFKQEQLNKTYTPKQITSFYNDNKTHFKDAEGKILPLEQAKTKVIKELNDKATKKQALRSYIDYKKEKLAKSVILSRTTISQSKNNLNNEVLDKISSLATTTSVIKPIKIKNDYFVVKLIKTVPSHAKTFQEAKKEILPLYIATMKKEKLLTLATRTLKSFKGQTTDFITQQDIDKINGLTSEEAKEFLSQLFNTQEKLGFITLNNGKIIQYDIVEQSLLNKNNNNLNDSIVKIKNTLFNEGLMKNLKNKYNTEIFIEGL